MNSENVEKHKRRIRLLRVSQKSSTTLNPHVRTSTPRSTLCIQVLLAWIQALGTATLFLLIGRIIDNAISPAMGHTPTTTTLLGISLPGVAVIVAVLTIIAAGFSRWFTKVATAHTEKNLRAHIHDAFLARGVVGTRGNHGEFLTLATTTTEKVALYRGSFLGSTTGSLTTPLIVLLLIALTIDPLSAGILTVLLILIPLLVAGFQRSIKPLGAAYHRGQARLTAAFLEALNSLETLVYARAAQRIGERLAHAGERYRKDLMKMLLGNQLIIFVVDGAFALAIVVAATALGIIRLHSGALTFGQTIALIALTILIIGPVDTIGQFFYIGMRGRAGERTISHMLTTTPTQITTTHTPQKLSTPAIALENVTCGWTPDNAILHNINEKIYPGEHVALVGPSGAGKSTLSALIQAYILPIKGNVSVNGYDTSTTSGETIRSALAVVEQKTFLFMGMIADNLRIAKPDATDEELWETLELANLAEEIHAMPQQLATPVGTHGSQLSGGQQQRLAIARAHLHNAPILILDEPTSQVDLAGEARILAALTRLSQGKTTLMIAHRPEAIETADRIITLTKETAAH